MKPQLSQEETVALIRKAHAGDTEARNAVVLDNQAMVHMHARRATKSPLAKSLEYDDIVGYGNVGLIRAIESYDPGFKTKFVTYAYSYVSGVICNSIKNDCYLVRLPMNDTDLCNKIESAILAGTVGDDEIGKVVGVSAKHVRDLRLAPRRSRQIWDFPANRSSDPAKIVEENESTSRIEIELGRLGPRKREIIESMMDQEYYPKLHKKFGVSMNRVMFQRRQAIATLRERLKDLVA